MVPVPWPSATVTFDCAPSRRPRVTVECPAGYVFGGPTTLRAIVEGLRPDEVAYTWALNGRVLLGQNGPTLNTTLLPNDVIGVTAVGPDGVAAETAGP